MEISLLYWNHDFRLRGHILFMQRLQKNCRNLKQTNKILRHYNTTLGNVARNTGVPPISCHLL